MKDKVLQWIKTHDLIAPGQTVICAVSGGADSVAMLHLMMTLQQELNLTLKAVHFNHHLRGAESDRDEAFVRNLCAAWSVPLIVCGADVSARAQATGESIEEAARILRYEFFSSLEGQIATAHTADDNLETIFLNLLRGTSLQGLCGIPVKRGQFIRPVLCLRRDEIEAYLQNHVISHVEDSSNHADDALRNRLRHQIVPLLKAENPALSNQLLRMSQTLRDDAGFLQNQAQQALQRAAVAGGWDCRILRNLPQALQSRCAHLIAQKASIQKITSKHILGIVQLFSSENPSAKICLPNQWIVRRIYDTLVLDQASQPSTFCPVPLNPNGITIIESLALKISCHPASASEIQPSTRCTWICKMHTAHDECNLCVRPRLCRDEICLPGGTRSLKRLFIDRKIPAAVRESVPVIADKDGVLGVYEIGVNLARQATKEDHAIVIRIEKLEKEETEGYGK